MNAPRAFASWLASHFDRFVALKQASGALYITQRRLLLAFDRYLITEARRPPLESDTLRHYLISLERLTPRARDNAVDVVWQALIYARRHGAAVDEPPPRPAVAPVQWRLRSPRILQPPEIQALLAAARRLRPPSRLRSATTASLLGLLAVSGLRIGEALALDVGDFDPREGLLTVRQGKFGKSRLLPLRSSTVDALKRYLRDPRRPVGTGADAPFFVSGERRRLHQATVWSAWRQVCQSSGLSEPWPRLHDFRHSFAVNRVATWYREGRDVDALLPVLSTYLGHVSVQNTRTYLVANGALLEQALGRFAEATGHLDEVSP